MPSPLTRPPVGVCMCVCVRQAGHVQSALLYVRHGRLSLPPSVLRTEIPETLILANCNLLPCRATFRSPLHSALAFKRTTHPHTRALYASYRMSFNIHMQPYKYTKPSESWLAASVRVPSYAVRTEIRRQSTLRVRATFLSHVRLGAPHARPHACKREQSAGDMTRR